jgi:hypothetical protein
LAITIFLSALIASVLDTISCNSIFTVVISFCSLASKRYKAIEAAITHIKKIMLTYHDPCPWEIISLLISCILVSCIKESYEYDSYINLTHQKMQKTIQKYIIHNEKELDDIDITLER